MAVRQSPPMQQRPFAVNAAILLSLALFAAPALAVTSTALPCNKSKKTTLDVQVTDLISKTVSNEISGVLEGDQPIEDTVSSLSLLAPRAEAAIREAFSQVPLMSTRPAAVNTPMAGTETSQDPASAKQTDSASEPTMHTSLPGVSEVQLSRYRKQMYRKDI